MAAGLSHAKMVSLRSLAERIIAGDLDIDRLPELSDADVARALTAVTGIGEWTASVFLIFTLHRADILARGDLGIRNAARRAYHLDRVPDPATLTTMGEAWRPYRTRACLYLWRSLRNTPIVAA